MKMTQKDYVERVTRLADGTSENPDDDRRLVELYEREGYTLDGGSVSHAVELDDSAQAVDEPVQERDAQQGTHERAPSKASGRRGTR